MSKRYIIYSPEHEQNVPGFTKTNGEVVPERIYTVHARALYRAREFTNRRYRRMYPDTGRDLILFTFDSIKQAMEELHALERYCGEKWEIHEYEHGKVGAKIAFLPDGT